MSQESTLARAIKTRSKNLPVEITLTGDYGRGASTSWTRYRDSEGTRTKTKNDTATKNMERWAQQLQANIRMQEHATLPLPMLGYYGTGRLWSEKKLTQKKNGQNKQGQDSSFYVRTFGYRDAMDPASSFKAFKIWFTWLSRAYNQHQNEQMELLGPERVGFIEPIPEIEDPLKVVRQAIDDILLEATGWSDLRYSELNEQSLMLSHGESGRMKIDQLSEGIQSMIGMVADIAYRCTKLNPQLGERAAKETQGVVLIDEVYSGPQN
jgi:predicted ATP-binding protein involved in virulence